MNGFISWLFEQTPTFGFVLELALVLLGGTIAMFSLTWGYTRIFATWIHEAGHAVFAFLSGRKIVSIKMQKDTSGSTVSMGVDRGFGKFITTFMGYPAPGLLGFLFLFAVANKQANLAAVGFALLVVLLLPFQRSLLGILITIAYGGLLWVLAGLDSTLYVALLLVLSGYFLFASPRTIVELNARRKMLKRGLVSSKENMEHSDADSLSQQTRIPAIIWEWVFLVLSGLFLLWGLYLLFISS